jgi:hypothetical protein
VPERVLKLLVQQQELVLKEQGRQQLALAQKLE